MIATRRSDRRWVGEWGMIAATQPTLISIEQVCDPRTCGFFPRGRYETKTKRRIVKSMNRLEQKTKRRDEYLVFNTGLVSVTVSKLYSRTLVCSRRQTLCIICQCLKALLASKPVRCSGFVDNGQSFSEEFDFREVSRSIGLVSSRGSSRCLRTVRFCVSWRAA
jgi:hypothetical protein